MISQNQQRALILSRMFLNVVSVVASGIKVHRRNAESLVDSLLIAAIYVGQHERQPMTAHKLAQYSGIPRPTVVRKLRELQAVDLIDVENGLAFIPQRVLDRPAFAANVRQLNRVVKKAAAMLSKLDT